MLYVLILNDYLPATTNQLLRWHWAVKRDLKQRDIALVTLTAQARNIPPATRKRKVSLRVEKPRGRPRDADNSLKWMLDILKLSRLLIDDGPSWCEVEQVESGVAPRKRTLILLGEAE